MPFAISNVDLEQNRRIALNTQYIMGLENSYVQPL